ncbi:dTDP-4-dehydrorhamnose 3,5-epimerase [Cytophagaceae bacterium DM2B3-1]|uniref:dTDP-4-dehydrorhamnose 3,5-epimerase n=1 Tax=Xanthocytophaga flava TaxID=3048013 RepID=A0ABT7CF87_9BACT|nr:dTDP-4-dehydrorhamnose 3,5-epimerase [Xanthocytophaga flavus]MDJ1472930.1 dTDP-4-dehydrorhamnose 3,5-epimerase [Xanthocytophaga flavus]MDJ1492391.1 dTDP-4-dehydrorhamnose 3,5-epimerase [Xanthocytophaga flavus]
MIFTETELKGAFILEIKKLEDERGFFGRSWCKREMEEHGLNGNVVQTNVSYNKVKGTFRGMHFQRAPHQETKLVRCTKGAILDVIIDLRPASPTYKKWIAVELTEKNHKMLYVPEDFAHGFVTLEDETEVTYQVTQFYTPGAEGGLRWNDPAFGIQLPITPTVISAKDAAWADYTEALLTPVG